MGDDEGVIEHLAEKSAKASRSLLAPSVDENAIAAPPDIGEPRPSIARTERVLGGAHARSISVAILAVLATFYTMYFARAFLVPIVFAILLNFLFSPALRFLVR